MAERGTAIRDPADVVDLEVHVPDARRSVAGSGNYIVGVADLVGRGGCAALVIYFVTWKRTRVFVSKAQPRKLKGGIRTAGVIEAAVCAEINIAVVRWPFGVQLATRLNVARGGVASVEPGIDGGRANGLALRGHVCGRTCQ
jgi:hypothetical protein